MKLISILMILITLFWISPIGLVFAPVNVGVKGGDWIEYNLEYSGLAPRDHPEWIKIDVYNVEGTSITANLTLVKVDGTTDTVGGTYNLETGVLDLLLIPANLDKGDDFFHIDFGRVIIGGVEEYSYCNAKRRVNFATIDGIECHWDMVTGILLESEHSTNNFSQKMVADKTNMWDSQTFGIDSTIFYIIILTILTIIAITVFIFWRKQ